jgi:hypothetical protein
VVWTPVAAISDAAAGFASALWAGALAAACVGTGFLLSAIGSSMSGFLDAHPATNAAKTSKKVLMVTEEVRLEKMGNIRIYGFSIDLSKFAKRYMIKQINLI